MARNLSGFTLLIDSLPSHKNKYVKYVGRDKVFKADIIINDAGWERRNGIILLPRGAIGVCSGIIGSVSMYIAFKSEDNLLQPPYKSSYNLEAGWKYQVQIYPGPNSDWEIEI